MLTRDLLVVANIVFISLSDVKYRTQLPPTRLSAHLRSDRASCDRLLVVQEGDGEWVSLDSEIIMKNGEPIGTQTPTGHYVLLDTRFEPPPGIFFFS